MQGKKNCICEGEVKYYREISVFSALLFLDMILLMQILCCTVTPFTSLASKEGSSGSSLKAASALPSGNLELVTDRLLALMLDPGRG